MNTIFLAISPIEIITVLCLTILLYIVALFLASKAIKGWRFFVWLLVIIFIPIVGAASYLIYHFANMKSDNTVTAAND